MRALNLIASIFALSACGIAPQPESNKTVEAYEVPLPTEAERDEFLAILSAVAVAEGMHLDSADPEELQRTGEIMPAAKMTIHAAVWRGEDDTDSEATILDQADHLGQVWIMFAKGKDPARARHFRERAMEQVRERWPETLSLPITGSGGIPLREDMVRTPNGYEMKPDARMKYGEADTVTEQPQ